MSAYTRQLISTSGKNRPPTPEKLCAVEHSSRKKEHILAPCTLPAKRLQITPTHLLREKIVDVRGDQDLHGNSPKTWSVLTQFQGTAVRQDMMEPASEKRFCSPRSITLPRVICFHFGAKVGMGRNWREVIDWFMKQFLSLSWKRNLLLHTSSILPVKRCQSVLNLLHFQSSKWQFVYFKIRNRRQNYSRLEMKAEFPGLLAHVGTVLTGSTCSNKSNKLLNNKNVKR